MASSMGILRAGVRTASSGADAWMRNLLGDVWALDGVAKRTAPLERTGVLGMGAAVSDSGAKTEKENIAGGWGDGRVDEPATTFESSVDVKARLERTFAEVGDRDPTSR